MRSDVAAVCGAGLSQVECLWIKLDWPTGSKHNGSVSLLQRRLGIDHLVPGWGWRPGKDGECDPMEILFLQQKGREDCNWDGTAVKHCYLLLEENFEIICRWGTKKYIHKDTTTIRKKQAGNTPNLKGYSGIFCIGPHFWLLQSCSYLKRPFSVQLMQCGVWTARCLTMNANASASQWQQ